jgi:hypothetical protein
MTTPNSWMGSDAVACGFTSANTPRTSIMAPKITVVRHNRTHSRSTALISWLLTLMVLCGCPGEILKDV